MCCVSAVQPVVTSHTRPVWSTQGTCMYVISCDLMMWRLSYQLLDHEDLCEEQWLMTKLVDFLRAEVTDQQDVVDIVSVCVYCTKMSCAATCMYICSSRTCFNTISVYLCILTLYLSMSLVTSSLVEKSHHLLFLLEWWWLICSTVIAIQSV